MLRLPTLVSLLLLAVPKAVFSSPCVAFDASFNLLTFGLNGKDWNAGQQGSWTSGSASDITTTGRPPFDGTNTTCYLSQFYNAIYFMNADKSNPSDVHIYNAGGQSWSTQTVSSSTFDPSSFDAILDHDTNVFYALSKGTLFFLDMGSMTTANSTALSWVDVAAAPYPTGYTPVMALAQNHIHFLDVPGAAAGSADIFVIHFSYFQPTAQTYNFANGSTSFPSTYGKTASFFQSSGVQQEFAFIPDDGSATYVINVETNTTTALAGPTTKDAAASYAASISALVQLDSTGALSYIPYTEGDESTDAQASWTGVSKIAAVAPASKSSAGSSSTGSVPKGSGTSGGAGASSTGSAGASKSNTGSMVGASYQGCVGAALAVLACVL
ncbi:hypothetical protein B0H21DRAFT_754015 [Amylocystis lapponica]|nr:hypothetical protein B0H21DRAFT_754015 [Amylocystis lapponica]